MLNNQTSLLALFEETPGVFAGDFGPGITVTVDTNQRRARVLSAPALATDADFDAVETVLGRLGILLLDSAAVMIGSLIMVTANF